MALQFGHACLRVETHRIGDDENDEDIRFNSATPACAWRQPFPVPFVSGPVELQFGHACLRVETSMRTAGSVIAARASIRPRLLARGDTCWSTTTRRHRRRLQFGHACLRVETRLRLLAN